MLNSTKVRIGVIGLGNMGSSHASFISGLDNAALASVCDIIPEKADKFAEKFNVKAYYNHKDMLEDPALDAVLVATPHYDHVPVTIDALRKGVHVLCEKPLTVHVNGARNMIEAYGEAKKQKPDLVFGIMLNERTFPYYKKIKDIITGGELGRLTRVTWINTAWFRSQAYYDSGGWRATWAGEGGGTLTNQCPHNLDMYQWLFGMPAKVNGFAHLGKYHNIEVEDEVTAYMEHDNGMIGHFIVTTGECPGVNRLEIAGENGALVYCRGQLIFYRNRVSMLKYLNETKESFGTVENWETHIPVDGSQPYNHPVVIQKFAETILTGHDVLIARGEEGLNQVMLANGIMLSSFNEAAVRFPLNGDAYERKLEELIKASVFVKHVDAGARADLSKSFAR
ncbi:MAG: Gfo/Idh/MocA family oxidoreductase [Clostridiales bacterium]|jgi:predicted dehydrogenase|nr:Gfo/Idh/MocA family oxidoreductase [Clostridiales bacterium]